MIVRGIDAEGNWLYGRGKNDYLKDQMAVSQMIKTRLKSFLGDCFFDSTGGIDWFNLLGGKDLLALQLSISACILNTEGVTAILALSVNLSKTRAATIICSVETIYGKLNNLTVEQNVGLS